MTTQKKNRTKNISGKGESPSNLEMAMSGKGIANLSVSEARLGNRYNIYVYNIDIISQKYLKPLEALFRIRNSTEYRSCRYCNIINEANKDKVVNR